MRNMSLSTGTITNHAGKNFPRTTTVAADVRKAVHITVPNKMPISMIISRINTVSNQLHTHPNLVSILTVRGMFVSILTTGC